MHPVTRLTATFAFFCTLTACDAGPLGVEPADVAAVSASVFPTDLRVQATADNPGFHFLPPLSSEPEVRASGDPSFLPYLTMAVCPWNQSACSSEPETFTAEGKGPRAIRYNEEDGHYVVNWRTPRRLSTDQQSYVISVFVGDMALGSLELLVVAPGVARHLTTDLPVATAGSTVPVKFVLEAGLPGASVLGPEGGDVVSLDGSLEIVVPPGALGATELVSIDMLDQGMDEPTEAGSFAGPLYRLEPHGVEFATPVTLAYRYPAWIEEPEYLMLSEVDLESQLIPWDHRSRIESDRLVREVEHFSYWLPWTLGHGLIGLLGDPEFRIADFGGIAPARHTDVRLATQWAFATWSNFLPFDFIEGPADGSNSVHVEFVDGGLGAAGEGLPQVLLGRVQRGLVSNTRVSGDGHPDRRESSRTSTPRHREGPGKAGCL